MAESPPAPVRSWHGFTALLGDAGQSLAWPGLELDELDQAEGVRYLARLLENAVGAVLGPESPRHPAFRVVSNGFGMDNPDNRYLGSPVDPRLTYRITGKLRRLSYLSFAAQSQNFARSSSITGGAGQLHGSELVVDDDDRFTIIASTAPSPGNWLRLADDSSMVLVRQTRADPSVESWIDVGIECLDGNGPPPPLDPTRIADRMATVALYAGGAAAWFVEWVRPWLDRPNRFELADPDEQRVVGGDPNILAQSAYWRLGDDEALIVEFTPPRCAYWNIQLANVWAESLDRRRPVWHNHTTARLEPDGSVRFVVAHRDPGHPNWLDPAGHRQGTAHIRYVLADAAPPARTRVVPVDALAAVAPPPSSPSPVAG